MSGNRADWQPLLDQLEQRRRHTENEDTDWLDSVLGTHMSVDHHDKSNMHSRNQLNAVTAAGVTTENTQQTSWS